MDHIALAFRRMALLTGGLEASACGRIFPVIRSTTTSDDALIGTSDSITGQDLVLKYYVSDCPELAPRTPITLSGKNYKVKSLRLISAGLIGRIFLEETK